jgi:hypothetical protein
VCERIKQADDQGCFVEQEVEALGGEREQRVLVESRRVAARLKGRGSGLQRPRQAGSTCGRGSSASPSDSARNRLD